jgi:ribulose-bisphosphate carboxylase large chain
MSPDRADYRSLIGTPESVPSDTHVLVKYRIRGAEGIPLDTIAIQCALDGSTVSWAPLSYHTPAHLAAYTAKVRRIDQTDDRTGIVELAFPVANIRPDIGGIPLLLATIAGSIFRERAIESIRVIDIEFPPSFLAAFPGPRYGSAGLRGYLGVPDRPLLFARIHDVGLTPTATAELAYEIALGGADVIYTSPLLVESANSPLLERVEAVTRAISRAAKRVKGKTLYFPNLTVNSAVLHDTARAILGIGAAGFEVDMLSAGFSAVQAVRESIDSFIIFYPITHSLYTRPADTGIDLSVILKLGRLVGADMTCISSVVGRFEYASPIELVRYRSVLTGASLNQKPSLPVAIGGIHPGSIRKTLEILGTDIGLSAGTGILGHPAGPRAGATAMRQGIDAYCKKLPPADIGKFREYEQALGHWGEE